MLPEFDPFGISSEADVTSQAEQSARSVQDTDAEEPNTPLSGAAKTPTKHKFSGRHRRTTSEPTPMDSWQLRSEWPQH